jgi:predicted flap endonuclease-1-like 5' DNA nuclease
MKQAPRRTAGKATSGRDVVSLEDIPYVGTAVASDLHQLGITHPDDLLGRDPYGMYNDL